MYIWINVRENRNDKKRWTIQRNCQHLAHKTQDEEQTYIRTSPVRVVSRHHDKYELARRGRDRIAVGFTTTCTISAYHH